MKKQITFNDVLIEPQYSEIKSRNDVILDTYLSDNLKFSLPICGANMKNITGSKMAIELYKNGAFGILHRFMSIEKNVEEYLKCKDIASTTSVSIGIKENEKDRFVELYLNGARIITIDIAHGHSLNMKNMIQYIKEYDQDITVIAGNIATGSAAIDLYNWGADVIKIGIGPSPVCETRRNTGVGVSQLYALKSIDKTLKDNDIKIPRIADGGIKYVGDISKALKYSEMCMLGSMLSGYTETPCKFFQRLNDHGELEWYTMYGGSASSENTGNSSFSEGRVQTVPLRGKVKYQLRKIEDGLRSAFSYSNSKNLSEYQEKCKLNEISIASIKESKF